MVGRSLFLHPTTFPPAVLGEVSSSKLQATSQALKPQASSIKPPILKPPASCLKLSCFPWAFPRCVDPGQTRRLPGTWDPTTLAQAVKHVYQGPSAALDVAGAHKGKGGNAAINGITQLTGRGTSYWSSSITASTANVPDGFKILHAQRAAKCARLAEAAAAAAAPATDDA
ncbi:hypothetical protein FB451DRAFT_1165724 [Mycena latifolia]|nr:hypothetical protein FB451DRAFT_1165724 [Mycena latifolia]